MRFSTFATFAIALFFIVCTANAEIVTVTTTGTVTLSELDTFAQEDTITGSFSYDSTSEGESFASNDGTLSEIKYSGISASFRNGSGTFAVDTTSATIIITRVTSNSTFYTPRHELRLFFPDTEIPDGGTNKYPAFIGFLSFSDRTLSVLKDGKLPLAIDHSDFQTTRFLFAWNRKPSDEAPLEYAGRLLPTPTPTKLDLRILPTGELVFTAHTGFMFQIEYSDDLLIWTPFGDPIQGEGKSVSRFVSTSTTPTRLFRVRTTAKSDQ